MVVVRTGVKRAFWSERLEIVAGCVGSNSVHFVPASTSNWVGEVESKRRNEFILHHVRMVPRRTRSHFILAM